MIKTLQDSSGREIMLRVRVGVVHKAVNQARLPGKPVPPAWKLGR